MQASVRGHGDSACGSRSRRSCPILMMAAGARILFVAHRAEVIGVLSPFAAPVAMRCWTLKLAVQTRPTAGNSVAPLKPSRTWP